MTTLPTLGQDSEFVADMSDILDTHLDKDQDVRRSYAMMRGLMAEGDPSYPHLCIAIALAVQDDNELEHDGIDYKRAKLTAARTALTLWNSAHNPEPHTS